VPEASVEALEELLRETSRHVAVCRAQLAVAEEVADLGRLRLTRHTVSHDWLHRAVWGVPVDRSVEVYGLKLRRKLAAASDAYTYIHTHHRVGYRFEPLPAQRPVGGPGS
jgi:DNA-binding response OmpR family regulator